MTWGRSKTIRLWVRGRNALHRAGQFMFVPAKRYARRLSLQWFFAANSSGVR